MTEPVTPPCRICGKTKWVAIFRTEAPKEAICMECCGGDVQHADGETGHQWSVHGEGCDYCGMSRHDAGPDYAHDFDDETGA